MYRKPPSNYSDEDITAWVKKFNSEDPKWLFNFVKRYTEQRQWLINHLWGNDNEVNLHWHIDSYRRNTHLNRVTKTALLEKWCNSHDNSTTSYDLFGDILNESDRCEAAIVLGDFLIHRVIHTNDHSTRHIKILLKDSSTWYNLYDKSALPDKGRSLIDRITKVSSFVSENKEYLSHAETLYKSIFSTLPYRMLCLLLQEEISTQTRESIRSQITNLIKLVFRSEHKSPSISDADFEKAIAKIDENRFIHESCIDDIKVEYASTHSYNLISGALYDYIKHEINYDLPGSTQYQSAFQRLERNKTILLWLWNLVKRSESIHRDRFYSELQTLLMISHVHSDHQKEIIRFFLELYELEACEAEIAHT